MSVSECVLKLRVLSEAAVPDHGGLLRSACLGQPSLTKSYGLFAHSREQTHTSSSDALLKTECTHLATLPFWSVFTGDFLSTPV